MAHLPRDPLLRSRAGLLQRAGTAFGSALPDPLLFLCLVIAVVGAASSALQLTVVGVVVLCVVLLSRLWSRLSLERVIVRRSFSRHRVFRGDELRLDVVIENRKPLPLPWVKLGFLLPDGLVSGAGDEDRGFEAKISFYETFSLGRYERVRAERSILARQRGCYRLGVAHVESGDLFGFYTSRAEIPMNDEELVVYPLPRPLPGFTLPARVPDGEAGGPALLFEDYSRPSGSREYQPGDPLRLMDWKTTARQRRPFVRTFDPSNGHQVIVLLECGTSEQLWRFRPERLEAAVAAAASVCVLAIDAGHQVGLVANGLPLATGRPVLRPAGGHRQLEALMYSLARVQPMPTWPLERLVAEHASAHLTGARDATLVYVTARPREETLRLLEERCRRGAAATCIHVGDPPPPEVDFMPVHDLSDEFVEPVAARPGHRTVLEA